MATKKHVDEGFWRLPEFARHERMSYQQAHKLAKSGRIPGAYKDVFGRWRITKSDYLAEDAKQRAKGEQVAAAARGMAQ